MSPSPASKRVRTELADLTDAPLASFVERVGPVSDSDLLTWQAVINGPRDSAYESGRWRLDIQIPDSYPMKPPQVRFDTRVCHPNVSFKTGEICLDLLKDAWSPANTILSTLDAIHQMLAYPEPDSPLNVDVAVLMRQGDLLGAESLIRWCCRTWRWSE